MTFTIPGEFEQVINQAVAAGAFPTPEDALRHGLGLLAEKQNQHHHASTESPQIHETWMSEPRAWSAAHPPLLNTLSLIVEEIFMTVGASEDSRRYQCGDQPLAALVQVLPTTKSYMDKATPVRGAAKAMGQTSVNRIFIGIA